MDTLGSYLRSAREAKGMDLRDAAQQTRISINYLRAIEAGDFSKLPGEVFVKGFLKSYARFLQLSEQEVMVRYAELTKPAAGAPVQKNDKQKATAESQQSVSVPEPDRSGTTSWELYLWSGIAVIALAALLLIVIPQRHPAKEAALPAASRLTGTTTVTPAAATAVQEKLYLDIIALDDVWVLVRTDSSPQKKAVLRKGEAITWSADARFLVSYGSIGAAKLVLNGKELTVTGPKNAVVRDLIITASGVAFQKFEAEKPKQPKPKAVSKPVPTMGQQPMPAASVPAPPPPASPKPAPRAASPIESILSPRQ